MGNPKQYYPSSEEFLWVGLIGIFLYLGILYFSVSSMVLGFRSKSTQRFFASVMIMAVLELPRFFSLAVEKSYTSKTTYCFHIIAGIFFFLAFSIVCRQWSGLLQLGSSFRVIYGYHSLIVSNVVFAIIDIISVGVCAASTSLEDFFDSQSFEVITFLEGIRNCVYSIFLSYYGLKLVQRFWHFSKLEKQTSRRQLQKYYAQQGRGGGSFSSSSSSSWRSGVDAIKSFFTGSYSRQKSGSIASSFDAGRSVSASRAGMPQLPVYDQVFTTVVTRLTLVLSITTICFVFRLTMLVLKMVALHTDDTYTTPAFTLFGVLWFICSDFIPRAVPSFAFIFLMRTKKPATGVNGTHMAGNTVTGRGGSGEDSKSAFQFVVFSQDEEEEEEYHYDAHDPIVNPLSQPSGLEDSKSVSILKADQFMSQSQFYYDQKNQERRPINGSSSRGDSISSTLPKFIIADEDDTAVMITEPHTLRDFRDSISQYDESEDRNEEADDFGTDLGEVAIDTVIAMFSPLTGGAGGVSPARSNKANEEDEDSIIV